MSSEISKLIQSATKEIIANTEEMINSVGDSPREGETVTVMFNGVKTKLNKEDYVAMKAKNKAISKEIKQRIKENSKKTKVVQEPEQDTEDK